MLPDYEQLYEWMHSRGMEPWPCPYTAPTKVGLGRYLMACGKRDLNSISLPWLTDIDIPEWDKIYRSCSWAYAVLLQDFRVRLPKSTFRLERLRVEELILQEPRPDRRTPQGSDNRVYRDKVLRWARQR